MNVLNMALRHVLRSRRRTMVTTGAMAFAGATMIFYAALIGGFTASMERHALAMDTADVQIHARGYLDDPDLYKRIEPHDPIMQALTDQGFKATGRLHGQALVAAGKSSSGGLLRGVDLEREPQVTALHTNVVAGHWLSTEAPKGVVIGGKLARTLDVGVGAELVLLSQDAQGFMANDVYTVRGILGTVNEGVDRAGVMMSAQAFRALMDVPQGVHQIVVARRTLSEGLETIRADVERAAGPHEVKTWRQLLPVLASMLDSSGVSMTLMIFITYAAISMVVLNAMLMSVFERIGEFGVMKAIGVSPWQVGSTIVLEAMIQAGAASVLALAVGVPVAFYFQAHGIDLSALTDTTHISGLPISPVWYCHLTPTAVVQPIVFLFVVALFSVLYPAVKAAVIQPVDALRHR